MERLETIALGLTGIRVSEFLYGAASIGGVGSSLATRDAGLSPEQGIERLNEAIDLGINVVDTADAYGGGESERTVGRWLAQEPRLGTLVATKVGLISNPDGSLSVSLAKERVGHQLEQSIKRLGHVDLYLAHAPDPDTPPEESLGAFSAALDEGKVRAFGVSNVTAPILEELLAVADKEGLHRPQWVQNRMNLLARHDEKELLPLVTAEGLGYTPFSPLAGGVLSERYLDDAKVAPGSRIAVAGHLYYKGFHTPENLARISRLREVAEQRRVSVAALALAWLRDHPAVTAPIVSPSKSAQWDAVREAVETRLSPDEHGQISAIFE